MPTNAQVIGEALLDFADMEYEVQITLAEYIECPNDPECAWDGKTEHLDVCAECKHRWLGKEWDF